MKNLTTFLTALALCLLTSGCGVASSQETDVSSKIAETSSNVAEVSAPQVENSSKVVEVSDSQVEEPSKSADISVSETKETSQVAENPPKLIEPLSIVNYPVATSIEDYETNSKIRQENPIEKDFLINLTDFSYETASVLLNENGNGNINYSPLSLYYALSIVATGAGGETKDELFDLLNVSTSEQLQEQSSNLYRLLYTDNEIS